MDKLKLIKVSNENYSFVVNLLMTEAFDRVQKYVMGLQTHPNLVRVVVNSETGEIYNIFYADASSDSVVRIHTVLSEKGRKVKDTQLKMYGEYLDLVFSNPVVFKVVVEVSERYRLIRMLTESFNFILEGTLRKEDAGIADILYYGLLREEYKNGW